jgi:hypothetical protein
MILPLEARETTGCAAKEADANVSHPTSIWGEQFIRLQ